MRRLVVLGVIAGLVGLALPMAARAQSPECEWLAGDGHVHTPYSHDVWHPDDDNTDDEDFYTFGWSVREEAALARSRGLDWVNITDHDDVRAQQDPDWGTTAFGDFIWVPNYENTVSDHGGHAQMWGATPEKFAEYESVSGPIAAAELIRRDGGAFQINHPSDEKWHNPDGTFKHTGWAPDSLEVWNIGAWFYQPPAPATNDHEFPVALWTDLLDQGFRVGGTGGSDSHWRSTTAAQGPGQPTTWVCVGSPNAQGLIDGIKAGRTSISHQPPAYMGPRAYLYADDPAQDGAFESMIGDTVTPGSTIRADIENGEGAWLQLVTNGGLILAKDLVTSFNFSKTYEVPAESTWVRAEVFYEDGLAARQLLQPLCDASHQIIRPDKRDERNLYCQNRLAMVAMTSPIYFEQVEFDPTTTLTYVGDTSVKVGDRATFAATLTDSNGDPLAGQAITFTFRGEVFEAITDESGTASTRTRVTGPPGDEVVQVDFAGTDTYSPSHIEQIVTVTTGQG